MCRVQILRTVLLGLLLLVAACAAGSTDSDRRVVPEGEGQAEQDGASGEAAVDGEVTAPSGEPPPWPWELVPPRHPHR